MPNDFLRDRIARKLASLPDERLYQVLDFVEFLETKYAEPAPTTTANFFQRFAEGVEDRLRSGKVSAGTIAETMNLMHKAVKVLDGVATAGKTVANDVAAAGRAVVTEVGDVASRMAGPTGTAGSGPAAGGTGGASAGGVPGATTPPGAPPAGPSAGQTPPSTPPSTGGSQ